MPRTRILISATLLALAVLLGAIATGAATETTANPLLAPRDTPHDLPPFDRLEPAHFEPAFAEGMRRERAEVEAIATDPAAPTFVNTIAALDRTGALLDEVERIFGGLTGANTNPELQAIKKRLSPQLAAHRDEIRLDPRLFARIEAVYAQRDALDLTDEQRFLLQTMYRSRVRNGARLAPAEQTQGVTPQFLLPISPPSISHSR